MKLLTGNAERPATFATADVYVPKLARIDQDADDIGTAVQVLGGAIDGVTMLLSHERNPLF